MKKRKRSISLTLALAHYELTGALLHILVPLGPRLKEQPQSGILWQR